MSRKKVVVVGAGYVGLPVACAFAGAGIPTYALDIVTERVRLINEGNCPILGDEPGLQDLLARTVKEGLLTATTDPAVIGQCDFVLVCVDTPIDEVEKQPRLDPLKGAVRSIGQYLKPGALVSIESTLPPLTMRNVVIPLLEEMSGLRAGRDFSVVHCPERVMPGRLLSNLSDYERVLGGLNERSIEVGVELYSMIVHATIHTTDLLSAELSKTLENAYRDVQIGFANEVALACEELGADAFKVRDLVNTCPFRDMHIPGAGVGGHCLPKDTWLFASSLRSNKMDIMTKAREVNEFMPRHLVELVRRGLADEGVPLGSSKVAVMGLAFLRNSDDARHSPALTVIDELHGKVRELMVHDPFVSAPYKAPLVRDAEEALQGADCMVIVTDHGQYFDLDLDRVRTIMRKPIIIDGRNVLRAEEARSKGFRYFGIGKGN